MITTSTITTIKTIGARLVILALTSAAVVGLGATTGATPVTGTALPMAMEQAAPTGPALNVQGMPEDFTVELLTEMDFTGNAPELADVTVVYGPDWIDAEDLDDFEVGILFGMGYQGDPNDGVDRLYAPEAPVAPEAPEAPVTI